MAIDLKILACVALCVVIVQGRAGDPSSVRRELLLKALKELRDDEQYFKRMPGESDKSEPVPAETEGESLDIDPAEKEGEEEDSALDVFKGVLEGMKQIVGADCADAFESAFNTQLEQESEETEVEQAPEETEVNTEERRYGARGYGELGVEAFLGAMTEGISATYECLTGDDDGTNVEVPDANVDMTESIDDSQESEIVDDLANTNESDDVEASTQAPASTAAPEETVDETDGAELTRLVERELLKNLLKKRISELSKKGYNGKK